MLQMYNYDSSYFSHHWTRYLFGYDLIKIIFALHLKELYYFKTSNLKL